MPLPNPNDYGAATPEGNAIRAKFGPDGNLLPGATLSPAEIFYISTNSGEFAPGGLYNNFFRSGYQFPKAANIDPSWEALAKEQMARGPRANPYSAGVADQSRQGQMALYQQMQAARAGPSIAAMQGAGAQGQNVRAAMQGGSGVARMAAQQGAGMGGDVSQAVLAEQMRASQGLGGLASGLRGRDLQGAQSQAEAALRAQGLDNAARQFYASQGVGLNVAQQRAALENLKLWRRGAAQTTGDANAVYNKELEMGATMLAGA